MGVFVILAALAAPTARALNPTRALEQYNCRTWTRESGLPVNSVVAIAQTIDGDIWLGTAGGLARFDGTRFTGIDLGTFPGVNNVSVRTIAASRRGGLWVGFRSDGLGYFDGHQVIRPADPAWNEDHLNVHTVIEARDGTAWVAARKAVAHVSPDGKINSIQVAPDLPQYDAFAVASGESGRIWFSTVDQGVSVVIAGRVNRIESETLRGVIAFAIADDGAGGAWIGTARDLQHYDSALHRGTTLLIGEEIRALLIDRAGVLWIGSTRGLYRYFHGRLDSFPVLSSLATAAVLSICEDTEGGIWVGTRTGLSHVTDVKFPTVNGAADPKIEEVVAVAASARGGIWAGHIGGISYRENENVTTYGETAGLKSVMYKRLFEARDGRVYAVEDVRTLVVLSGGKVVSRIEAPNLVVGLAEDEQGIIASVGGSLYRVHQDRFVPFAIEGNVDFGWILNLLVARDGALWVATERGVFRIDHGHVQQFGKNIGLANVAAMTLTEDDEGTMWVGEIGGLVRIQNGRAQLLTRANGLWDDDIYGVVPDDEGRLWINSTRGVFTITRKSFAAVADNPAKTLTCQPYDGPDSVRAADKYADERVAARTADGRIWFPSMKGLLVIDPRQVPSNRVPPPVHIEHVHANGSELIERDHLEVPPGRGELSFQFTALSFTASDRIQFKYQLVGYDSGWVDAGTRRLAAYNNLRPGAYEFRVIAANSDGVWNSDGDHVSIELLPHYYETTWFLALCLAAAGAGLVALYRYRVRRLHRRAELLAENKVQLESEVARRTAELAESNRNLRREEQELQKRTIALEREIEERKRAEREIERVHRELLEVSRQAGMAEVATGVLHNVGNVLNSVNVSSNVVIERIKKSRVPNLAKVGALLEEHAHDLPTFLTADSRGRQIVPYITTLATHLADEQTVMTTELTHLQQDIEHIKDIVAMQQSYATMSGVTETAPLVDLVEDAIRINLSALERHGVTLERAFVANPIVTVERHKVMQILINVLRNAKYACDESGRKDKRVTVRIDAGIGRARVVVIDNGVGIAPENLTRIFAHGFTTRKAGHGFGLHSSALTAKELGGTLIAESPGIGLGATFILELPVNKSLPAAGVQIG